jgi:hypothetical protein
MIDDTVYLVKFNCGYYAKNQKQYGNWIFTDDPYLAHQYKSIQKAKDRGEYLLGYDYWEDGPTSYTIEEYHIITEMKLIEEVWGNEKE